MPITDATLSVLSWKQHDVLRQTLGAFVEHGVIDLFPSRRIFFNEFDAADAALAGEFGFAAIGSETNTGIFGGARALAEACRTEFMLFVENDCPSIVGAEEFADCMTRVIADMRAHDVPVFCLRSRRQPGEKFDRRERYERFFRIEQRLTPHPPAAPPSRSPSSPLRRLIENWRRPSLVGCALYAEEQPHLRHPGAIRRTENGNWLTSSSVLNWSNNCLLVRTAFFCDVVIPRVLSHPAPTTINGHQDIEAALKLNGWWRSLNVPMGQAEPGPLTHARG